MNDTTPGPTPDDRDTDAGILFYEKEDGTYLARIYPDDEITEIVIPESRKGKAITEIAYIDSTNNLNTAKIKSITIPSTVTKIGNSAFKNFSGLQSINIPDSVTEIGEDAFSYCKSLKDIVVPDSVKTIGDGAFSNCNNLSSASFGNSITEISKHAFSNCTSLKNITLTGNICVINEYAFSSCTNLTELTIGEKIWEIGNHAFDHCTALTTINFNATHMSDLEINNFVFASAGISGSGITVNVGKTVNKIPDFLFCPNATTQSDVPNVSSVIFSTDCVCESIGVAAFALCENLKNVQISELVSSIGNSAFEKTNLTQIKIPHRITSIGNFAFKDCEKLNKVFINDITEWCAISFGDEANPLKYAEYLCIGDTLVTSVVIPDNITVIPAYLFSCKSLKNLTIHDGVEYIADNAFNDCPLENVTIPSFALSKIPKTKLINATITSGDEIENDAFDDCQNLITVTIPNTLKFIPENIFDNCIKLSSICIAYVTEHDANVESSVFELPSISCTGYQCYWYDNEFFDGEYIDVISKYGIGYITVYPKFVPITYNIILSRVRINVDDGRIVYPTDGTSEVVDNILVEYNEKITLDKSNVEDDSFKNFRFIRWECNGETYSEEQSFVVEKLKSNDGDSIEFCAVFDGGCLTGDTLINLPNGSYARLDSLKAGDIILSWNAITGKFEAMPISLFWNHGESCYNVIQLNFSNEKSIKVVDKHGFFDVTLNKYVYIDNTNYSSFIGHEFAHISENGTFENVLLTSADCKSELTSCYSLRTACNDNAIANGFLTLTLEDFDGFLTYFEFENDYMYDKIKMEEDIAKYGLYTYDEWKEYVSYEEFVALSGQYLKIAVGKGYLTYEDILKLIEGMRQIS